MYMIMFSRENSGDLPKPWLDQGKILIVDSVQAVLDAQTRLSTPGLEITALSVDSMIRGCYGTQH